MSALGWFSLPASAGPGQSDRLLADLAERLASEGMRLVGAVQVNLQPRPDCACDMDLALVGVAGPRIRISQSLGSGASGCRLDPGALETAAGRVMARLHAGADLLILPKFGKQEALGRGFRQAIAQALEAGIPVLLHVGEAQRADFLAFAGDLAEWVDPENLAGWCRRAVGAAA